MPPQMPHPCPLAVFTVKYCVSIVNLVPFAASGIVGIGCVVAVRELLVWVVLKSILYLVANS